MKKYMYYILIGILAGSLSGCITFRSSPSPARRILSVLEKNNASLQRHVLDNGMTVLLKQDRSAPVVSVQIWVGTGSIHEDDNLGAGLSHALEHMVFKGTTNRKIGEITRDINNAGGSINAYTSFDRTVFHTDLPASKWQVGLDVLADTVMHASFPKGEWEKERKVILREFAMGKDDPGRVLQKLAWNTAYRVHPYRLPIIGHEDIFRQITRNDVVKFFDKHYVPDNMILVIVGDISLQEVETKVRETFASFKRRSRRPVILPREPRQLSGRFQRKTGAYKISRLRWLYHTVELSHEDTPALDLLAKVVGSGRSSRLNRRLKEELKLVLSIDAWSYTPKEPGLFGISASFEPSKEKKIIQAIQHEIDSWQKGPFRPEEIDKARRRIITSELSALQTVKGQASDYASGEFYAGDPRASETYLETLEKLSAEDLKAVALKYFSPEKRSIAILSPMGDKASSTTPASESIKPRPKKFLLSNGVPLIVLEDHRLPFVYFCAAAHGGLLSENEQNNGITKMMASLLTRGTGSRSSDDIGQTVESLGASLSPFSGKNSFGLRGQCLSTDKEALMAVFSDCLLHPVFSEKELLKQQTIQLASIRSQYERPFYMASKALRRILFPSHPYQWDILGTEVSVGKLSRDDIRDYYRKHLVRDNMALSIAGDISPSDARELAETFLNGVPEGAVPKQRFPTIAAKLPAKAKQREPKEQAILLAGFPGVDMKDPRHDALSLLSKALSGLSSKLSEEIREKRGLVYYVGTYQRTGVEPGSFVFYAGTREAAVEEVEELFREEILRLTTKGLTQEEMERARRQIIANHQKGLQQTGHLAMNIAMNELYGLGYAYTFSTEERFQSLTLETVRKAAASVLSTNKMAISVVLPEVRQEKEVKR